jgi:hypothetical protein
MGKTEGWGALLGAVGALIVEVAEASERRADGQGTAVCSLCRDLSSSLFPVSRGRLCPTCIAVAHLELAKDWRKLKEENDQLRALFREFDAAGMSLKEVVAMMTAVVTDPPARLRRVSLHFSGSGGAVRRPAVGLGVTDT